MVIDTLTCVILLLAVVLDAGLIWAWQTRRQRAGQPSPPQPALPPIARPRRPSLGIILFSAAVATFAITRLVGLENFPIYFFTDEAINTVQAANFIHHGFRDAAGQFFPTYFQNDQYVSLSVSVYLQVIPYVLFGFSEFVTRAVSVLVALSGTLAVGLILKHHFKSRWGWAGILLLSITPAWFLHSRTAFEHVVWVSFFAWFIYFYLRYRQDQPPQNAWRAVWKIAPALVAGALAFYSYNGGQLGMVVTGLLLLLVDWRYHWRIIRRSRRFAVVLMIVIGVLARPYVRFIATYPDETYHPLRLLKS